MSELLEARAGTRTVLAGLWITTMLVVAFVDIFGFYRADVQRGVLNGQVAGGDIMVNQAFLAFAVAYVTVPTLFIVAALLLPARINRPLQIGGAVLFGGSILAYLIGETWAYYQLGSIVELVLLAAIVIVAGRWPRRQPAGMPVGDNHLSFHAD